MERRQFLRVLGPVSLGGIAGCLGDDSPTSSETVTPQRTTPPPDTDGKTPTDSGDPDPTRDRVDEYSGPATTPSIEDIPENGTGENFELVGHNPLLDEHQYVGDESLGIPRGSNGEITVAGDCVYVGSFTGNQPPLVVDVADPADPQVVGPVPDAVPGVANGIEGIRAEGGVLAIAHRSPHGQTFAEVPDGLPTRGMSAWDISEDDRQPELVARYDHGDLETHALRLWQDPTDSGRVLAIQTFIDTPDIKVLDLTGCPDPDACDPEVVAEWSLEAQTGLGSDSHEAIMSEEGDRIYVAQPMEGFLQRDSSNLLQSLREGGDCDPSSPEGLPGDEHCLTVLDPDVESALEAQPPIQDGWHHTLQKVPERPYMLALSESTGPDGVDRSDPDDYGSCPGGTIQVFGLEENETLDPDPVGRYSLPEQTPENCGPDGWNPDEVAWPGWLSPHFTTPLPDVVFATYYSGGVRAIDIADPADPTEVGHFFNEPVSEVRWATYGPPGEAEPGADGQEPNQRRATDLSMFAFSYPVIHDGYVIYADVHSGLYVLEYTGPHAEQLQDSSLHTSS